MSCRHKQPHYHRYTDMVTTQWCVKCGVGMVDGWLRCEDNRPLCDDCYWEDPTLRYHHEDDDGG